MVRAGRRIWGGELAGVRVYELRAIVIWLFKPVAEITF
jgi:hypothetical protein